MIEDTVIVETIQLLEKHLKAVSLLEVFCEKTNSQYDISIVMGESYSTMTIQCRKKQ